MRKEDHELQKRACPYQSLKPTLPPGRIPLSDCQSNFQSERLRLECVCNSQEHAAAVMLIWPVLSGREGVVL